MPSLLVLSKPMRHHSNICSRYFLAPMQESNQRRWHRGGADREAYRDILPVQPFSPASSRPPLCTPSGAGRKNGSNRIPIINSRIAGKCIPVHTHLLFVFKAGSSKSVEKLSPHNPDHSQSLDGGRVGVWGRVMCSTSLLRCPISSSALNSLRQLSTAATRSARFLCHRQRSQRSPSRFLWFVSCAATRNEHITSFERSLCGHSCFFLFPVIICKC